MSTSSHKRKRLRERNHYAIDYQAEHEADAISKAYSSHTIDFGKRMNRYYFCDGEKFNTGKRHRAQAVGVSVGPDDRRPKVRKRHKSKAINLRLRRAIRDTDCGKDACRVAEARKAQTLMTYRAKLVRPLNGQIY